MQRKLHQEEPRAVLGPAWRADLPLIPCTESVATKDAQPAKLGQRVSPICRRQSWERGPLRSVG